MFRPIRRKKKEISMELAKELLRTERRGVLAVSGVEGYPYAVPINYFYDEEAGKIIFHGAKAGHKIEAIQANDKVCFTVYGNEQIKDEAWAPYMQSVVVFGRCHLVSDPAESIKLVTRVAEKYYPNHALIEEEIQKSAKAMQMFEITIEHLSGKEIQER